MKKAVIVPYEEIKYRMKNQVCFRRKRTTIKRAFDEYTTCRGYITILVHNNNKVEEKGSDNDRQRIILVVS